MLLITFPSLHSDLRVKNLHHFFYQTAVRSNRMNLLVSNRLKGHSLLSLLPFKHSFSVSLIPDIVIPDTHPSTAIVLIEGFVTLKS